MGQIGHQVVRHARLRDIGRRDSHGPDQSRVDDDIDAEGDEATSGCVKVTRGMSAATMRAWYEATCVYMAPLTGPPSDRRNGSQYGKSGQRQGAMHECLMKEPWS